MLFNNDFANTADRKSTIYKSARDICRRAAGSFDALRSHFDQLNRLADQLDELGYHDDANEMHSIADSLFRNSGTVDGRNFTFDSTASPGAYQSARYRLSERIERLEHQVEEIIDGRPARYDENTGQLVQVAVPGYWTAIQDILYGRPARYDENTGQLVQTPTQGVYTMHVINRETTVAPRFNWLLPVLIAAVAVLVAWVIGTWYNGATYAGWIAGIGAVLAAILTIVMNVPYFRHRS